MATDTKTVEIGFFGGATTARLSDDEAKKLRKAVERGEWVDLQTQDGPLSLNAEIVTYLRTDEHSATIGFGGS